MAKLERLCRYVARPPLALERLSVTDEGKLRYALKHPYSNGTTHFLFEPLDLLARLAALVPRPRVNLTRYHGVFAPNSTLRAQIVPDKPRRKRTAHAATPKPESRPDELQPAEPTRLTWAQRRVTHHSNVPSSSMLRYVPSPCRFECNGKLRGIADITDPVVIDKILTHIRQSRAPPAQAKKSASFTDSDQHTQART